MLVLTRGRTATAHDKDVLPESARRHPGDIMRVALAVAVVAVSLLAVRRDDLSRFEENLFRLVNDLPDWLRAPLLVVMQAGNVWAGPVIALGFLAARRWRAAFDAAVAGPLAWVAAKVVKWMVSRPRPSGLITDIARGGDTAGMGFVSGHTAVAFALAAVLSPHVTRTQSRLIWFAAWTVGVARIYEGAHLPLDVVGGAAVGWMIGAGLHLALGAPHRLPTSADVGRVLALAGLTVRQVRPLALRPRGSVPFVVDLEDRAVFVKLLDPEPRDRDLLYRGMRYVIARNARDEAQLADTRRQAEHEVAMTLLAREAGVRSPAVQRMQSLGRRVWLVQDHIDGQPLSSLPAEAVTDELLRGLWTEVARLHGAGIAHRDLETANVMVDARGRPWLVDYAHATMALRDESFDNDVAELLVGTAAAVGCGRAVRAAVEGLGAERVRRAAAELQPLALTPEARRIGRDRPGLLEQLRGAARADAAAPIEAVAGDGSWLDRWGPPAAAALSVGVPLAVAGPAAIWDVVSTASWRWVGVAVLAAVALFAVRAATIAVASRRPLGLGPTVLACAAAEASFLDRDGWAAAPPTAYLVRCGLGRGPAEATLRRRRVAVGVMASAVLVAAGVGALADDRAVTADWDALVLLGGAAAVAVLTGARVGGGRGWAGELFDRQLATTAVFGGVEVAAYIAVVGATASALGAGVPFASVAAAAAVAVIVGGSSPRFGLGPSELVVAAALVVLGAGEVAAGATGLVSAALLRWSPALVTIAGRGVHGRVRR